MIWLAIDRVSADLTTEIEAPSSPKSCTMMVSAATIAAAQWPNPRWRAHPSIFAALMPRCLFLIDSLRRTGGCTTEHLVETAGSSKQIWFH
jgi:hypothetical protein